jgi:hypothetical protein
MFATRCLLCPLPLHFVILLILRISLLSGLFPVLSQLGLALLVLGRNHRPKVVLTLVGTVLSARSDKHWRQRLVNRWGVSAFANSLGLPSRARGKAQSGLRRGRSRRRRRFAGRGRWPTAMIGDGDLRAVEDERFGSE